MLFIDNIKVDIQGRHAAIRLLVELSVLEVVGKYAAVPYWRCVPEGKADPTVIEKIEEFYLKLDDKNKISAIQQLLPYYGYKKSSHNGVLDKKTQKILDTLRTKLDIKAKDYTHHAFYRDLYFNIPI